MSKERKAQVIDSLKKTFSECSIAILTDYRGLSVPDITELRRKLREAGVEYRVVKNTLARFAAERSGREELASLFQGPIAIAFGYGDITEPARVLAGYIEASKSAMTIKGGFVPDGVLSPADVATLSKLPSREILLAQVVGGVQSPIYALASYLAAPMRGIVGVLQARIQQMEG